MYVIINGNKYNIPELSFDAVCELEERGVNILAMNRGDMKMATMIRGLVAWIMDVDNETASREIEKHIIKGGNIIDIMNQFSKALGNSSFLSRKGQVQTQDHNAKAYPKNKHKKGKMQQGKNQEQSVNRQPQNRAQRRANNKRNGNH